MNSRNGKNLKTHSEQILIVDDELMPAVRLESLLEKLGYGMAGRAESGEEAVRMAEALTPDLVMMDIGNLQFKNGL